VGAAICCRGRLHRVSSPRRPQHVVPKETRDENICFKYFGDMLQMFHTDVAKVDRDVDMLQWFVQYVASVCSQCFIYFQTYVASVFI
jgi:hypothetical protein